MFACLFEFGYVESAHGEMHAKFPVDPRCRFTNIQKQLPAPFVLYAEFESVLKPLSDMDTTVSKKGNNLQLVPTESM